MISSSQQTYQRTSTYDIIYEERKKVREEVGIAGKLID